MIRNYGNILMALVWSLVAAIGTAFVVTVVVAIVRIYLAGHAIEVPEFQIDYNSIHMTTGDILMLLTSLVTGVFVFVSYLKSSDKREG